MRQWMCNPMILCQKHLGGEHTEHHMFIGSMKKKISMKGYIDNDLFEPLSLVYRHDVLAWELVRRKILKQKQIRYNAHIIGSNLHNTWIEDDLNNLISYLPQEFQTHKIDKQNSLSLLLSRCEICKNRYNKIIDNYKNFDPIDSYYLPPIYNFINGI